MYHSLYIGEYADEKLAFLLASILLIGGVKKDPDANKWMSYFYEQCPVRHVNFMQLYIWYHFQLMVYVCRFKLGRHHKLALLLYCYGCLFLRVLIQ